MCLRKAYVVTDGFKSYLKFCEEVFSKLTNIKFRKYLLGLILAINQLNAQNLVL